MKLFGLLKSLVAILALGVLVLPNAAISASQPYDLQTDWSLTDNPNGPWACLQGTQLLPHHTEIGVHFNFTENYFAPSANEGNYLPSWWQGIDGDIFTHSVDWYNGNPSLGESTITWTSPTSGIISIIGKIWNDHGSLARSNDFFLYLGSTLLTSGTVSYFSHNKKLNAIDLSFSDLAIEKNDIISLVIQRSPGYSAGTVTGVNLTITETIPTADSDPKCVSQKLITAKTLCTTLMNCWVKEIKDAEGKYAVTHYTDKATQKFETSWGKAQDKADKKEVNCDVGSEEEIGVMINDAIEDIYREILSRMDQGNKDSIKLGGNLLKYSGIRCNSLLNAQSTYLKSKSAQKDAKLSAAIARADKAFTDSFNKACAKAINKGLSCDDSIKTYLEDAIDNLESDILSGMGL